MSLNIADTSAPSTASMSARVIRLSPADDVVIALEQLMSGTVIEKEALTASGLIPPGHKVATRDIGQGEAVLRYGQVIGFASQPIRAGQHVHTHNLAMGDFTRDYAFGQAARPTVLSDEPATFQGIVREDGSVATRNYVGILTSVNCSVCVGQKSTLSRLLYRRVSSGRCPMRSGLLVALTCLDRPPRERQRGEVTVCLAALGRSNDINEAHIIALICQGTNSFCP